MSNKKAFTLMEIIVVIIVIGAMAGLALPRYTATMERMRASEGTQHLVALFGSQKRYEIENPGNYAADIADLDIEISPTNFKAPLVFNDTAKVASLERSTDDYVLAINDLGIISCTNGGSPQFTCTHIGY